MGRQSPRMFTATLLKQTNKNLELLLATQNDQLCSIKFILQPPLGIHHDTCIHVLTHTHTHRGTRAHTNTNSLDLCIVLPFMYVLYFLKFCSSVGVFSLPFPSSALFHVCVCLLSGFLSHPVPMIVKFQRNYSEVYISYN